MRVLPRRWDAETLVCALRGHVAPAARVQRLEPGDGRLGVELGGAARLSRCLRCDLWVRTTDPTGGRVEADRLPPDDELPRPRRGRQLEDAIVTRLIALERLVHCVLFTCAAVVLVVLDADLGGVRRTATDLSASLQGAIDNSGRGGSHAWLVRHLDDVGGWHLDAIRVLLVVAVAYALLEGAEAWGLWHERRWAEYLTVVATVGFLPFELHQLTERVTVLRLLALVVNVVVLVWLVWAKRLFGVRGGSVALAQRSGDPVDLGAPPRRPEAARC
jgi:uncharacterized membrane protein (DUF2068 family)